MEAKITFDEISRLSSGTATLWHYGTVKIGDMEYDFSLAEMRDMNWSSFEVTWVDKTPDNHEELDEAVIDAYQEQAGKEDAA